MSRATINTELDAALATIVGLIPSWITSGGRAELCLKTIACAISLADPAVGSAVQRRLGASFAGGTTATFTQADVTS